MDGVPKGIDMIGIEAYLKTLPTCSDVHDLHVWGMSTTEIALTAHVVLESSVCNDALLATTATAATQQGESGLAGNTSAGKTAATIQQITVTEAKKAIDEKDAQFI